ncbi:MAG TPA: hypothetical protein PKB02_06390 [Anaerohalosphaeraceae bacterium]|nr:hypothetical protein [Anaerohalosphaeraceae bacterium]
MDEKKNLSLKFGEKWQAFSQKLLDAEIFKVAVRYLDHWVGGYPYEYASKKESVSLMKEKGFSCMTFIKASVPTGYNIFVIQENAEQPIL